METLQGVWQDLGARVRRFIGSRVNDPHAADDIAQDVMLKVQTNLGSLPPEEKLPAWVIAVARNAVIDHYRARTVRETLGGDVPEPASDADDVEGASALHDLAACLGRMVEQLPEPYRTALKLADLQRLSQQEIADRVGMSLSGVKSRVQRARQQLGEMIRDCCRVERDARGNVIDYETTDRSARYCGDGHGRPQCDR
jgi:RNA polymerase sigma-70 factor (ECF subfamily)